MILARLALVTGLSCAALIAFPVKADVMEINADGARWVTGGSTALPAAPTELISAEPISEVPAECCHDRARSGRIGSLRGSCARRQQGGKSCRNDKLAIQVTTPVSGQKGGP